MARGPYTETETVRVLRALIDFVESDTPAVSFRTARAQGGRHPLALMTVGDGLPRGGPLTALWAMGAGAVEAERLALRAFLRFLAGEGQTAWPDMPVTLSAVHVAPHAVKWAIDGSVRDVLGYQVKTFLDRLGGVDRLRLCPAPDCGKVYLKIGRRENCSTRCAQRLYHRDYDPFAARARRSDSRPSRQHKQRTH